MVRAITNRVRFHQPKAVSLFSGAGGMDIGVRQAGYQILACIELDPWACETLKAASIREDTSTKVFQEDVKQIDPAVLLKRLDLEPGELDLLCGGPPCQAFSQIGKQDALDDERGLLLFQMVRYAKVIRPKAVLIEQVKGLLSAKDRRGFRGEVFAMLLRELEELGYDPKWKVLNAAEYGVPQLRKRVFVVATMKPNGFRFPHPTHSENDGLPTLFPLKPYVTAGEALIGLGRPVKSVSPAAGNNHVDVTPKGDRRRIHGVPEGKFLSAQIHLSKQQRGNLTAKDTTKFLRLNRRKPANTLRCGEIFFHPRSDRYLTPREYMRLHGYPDDYRLSGPVRSRSGRVRFLDQHRQVANSVPPPIAKLLAEEIRRVQECPKSMSFSASH